MAVLKIIRIGAAKGSNPSKGLAAALKYISNPEKTEDGNLVKSVNCRDTWKETYVDMMTTKKMFEKTDGSQGFHFVISFSPEENVSKHLCRVITDQFISGYLNDRYEVLSAIHTDTNHMHSHIVFNSVSSIDGKKYHCDKSEWRKIIMPKLNRICEQYHLNIMALENEELKEYIYPEDQKPLFYGRRLSRDDWEKARAGHKTWADFAAADIDVAIKKCYTYEEAIHYLQELGWQVKWKTKDGSRELKHFSMRPSREAYGLDYDEAWIRPDTRCGYGYSSEGIKERIEKDIFFIDDIELDEVDEKKWAADEGKYKRTWFEKLDYMPILTEYQKKRFINLKRTGQWERLQANKIPRELRKTVVEVLKTQNELIYMMQQGLDSREAVVKRKAYLILAKMKYQRPEEGSEACEKIDEEIELCNGLLNDEDVPEVGLGYWIGYGG